MTANSGLFQTFRDVGVLIVGHGTRDPAGQSQMRALACQTAGQLLPLTTELGFLELASPTIEEGVASLAAQGVRRLVTVPVLLFRAGHADRDIPDAVAAAAAAHGLEVLDQTDPLEHHPAVVELSAERFSAALEEAGCSNQPAENIALAMIARGSSSDAAAAAMCELARRRTQLTPVSEVRVGYVAVRRPNVAETLDWLASTSASLLVVQPHLLFEGEVMQSLRAAVDQRRSADASAVAIGTSPRPRVWAVCQPLGSKVDDFQDDRLARVLAQLVAEALLAYRSSGV